MTNTELLEDHLKEMRQHLADKKAQRDLQIDQDKAFLKRVHTKEEQDKAVKMRSSEILKNEFMFFNDQKQLDNKLRRENDNDDLLKSKLEFFPFVSGELLEAHRSGLAGQMRADLQNYLVSKCQANS